MKVLVTGGTGFIGSQIVRALLAAGHEVRLVARRGSARDRLSDVESRIEWREAEHFPYWTGAPFVGPQAVVNGVLARIPQDSDGFRIDVGRIVGAGDTVLVEARYRGTSKATGKPLDAQVAHVWDVRGGKVVRFQQYVDT